MIYVLTNIKKRLDTGRYKSLKEIYGDIKNVLNVELKGMRGFIELIIKVFLIIIIIMSICRTGSVLFDQIYPISELSIIGDSKISIGNDKNSVILDRNISVKSSHDVSYRAEYNSKDYNDLSFNLTRDEESFAHVVNLNNLREPGQIYIPNLVANIAIQVPDKSLPIDIRREFKVEREFNLRNFYSSISFNVIRNEIGMILFIIILINIYSLVPILIEKSDNKPDNKDEERIRKKNFCYLIMTSLILALILTLSPEGDIGDVRLNISIQSAISAFLMIISFVLLYLFMKRSD